MHKRKFDDEVGAGTSTKGVYFPSGSGGRRGRTFDGEGDGDLENIAYRDDGMDDDLQGPSSKDKQEDGGDDEVDPLDAFMAGIQEEVAAKKDAPAAEKPKPKREDLILEDEEDPVESFMAARRDAGLSLAADALNAGYDSDEEVYAAAKAVDQGMLEYDADDNPVVVVRKNIEPLPALNHASIDYEAFNKDFYDVHPEVAAMSDAEEAAARQEAGIRVSGFDVPRPVAKFEHAGFDDKLMAAIGRAGYERPTAIQRQAWPILLSGRDAIGIAKTGSGKTAAFVLPVIVHIMDQEELSKGEGPIGVICAPTRELAQQIYSEAKKFGKGSGLRVCGVFGGMSKFEQFKELKAGCEVVVATPGRLIDMLKMKALSMARATYLVLDEADRMFDMGFEPQVRSIVGQIRPDRQTALFSATMPGRVERLAREILQDPVRVTVGEVGRANEDIKQHVVVLPADDAKLPWLLNCLPERIDEGDVLLFAGMKAKVEEISAALSQRGFKVGALHGDKDQASRMEVLKAFKDGHLHVLVATDVAARGLDIRSIKSVINFDAAKDLDAHVHRIGRTGRAGDKDGAAYTLLTAKQAFFAGQLLPSLIAAGQDVPQELMDLAMKDGQFRAQREGRHGRSKGGKGRGGSKAGSGGRGVRGVDFGLGLGFSSGAEPAPKAVSQPPVAKPTAPPATASSAKAGQKTGQKMGTVQVGMMARFKNTFVAASSSGASSSLAAGVPGKGDVALPPAGGIYTSAGHANRDTAPGSSGYGGRQGGVTQSDIAAAAAAATARAAALAADRNRSMQPLANAPEDVTQAPRASGASNGKADDDGRRAERSKERRSRWDNTAANEENGTSSRHQNLEDDIPGQDQERGDLGGHKYSRSQDGHVIDQADRRYRELEVPRKRSSGWDR